MTGRHVHAARARVHGHEVGGEHDGFPVKKRMPRRRLVELATREGLQRFSDRFDPVRVATAVPGMTSATAVAAGADHTCWLLAASTLRCAGANAIGTSGWTAWANAMPPLSGVVSVGTGWMSTYAIDSSGVAWGFGSNGYQALTLPATIMSTTTPTRLVWH